jgi:hypothetical protein
MRRVLTARNADAALSGIILIDLGLSGAAYAINSAVFRYSTPQTGYLKIPAAALTPQDPVQPFGNNGASLVVSGNACFYAPVNLPDSVKMTQLAAWHTSTGSNGAFLTLSRQETSNNAVNTFATLAFADTGGARGVTAASIANPAMQIVNNVRYAYFIRVCLTGQDDFSGARIIYTYRTAGD